MSESDEAEVVSNEEEIDPFAQRIAEKMQIARNVTIECQRKHNLSKDNDKNDIESIIIYTGVCEETIRLADMALKSVKRFADWFQELAEADKYSIVFDRIRSTILELYTKKCCLRLRDEDNRLKKDILRHGFTWKRLPGTKKTILVEKADQSLQRMDYLTRIKAYRKAGRTIVYADAYFYYYQIMVSPQHGLLHMGLINYDDQCLDVWIKTLTTSLPSNSVVVLKEDPRDKKTPTPYTSKADMISWLSEQKVPHDPNLHRADLYALIKNCKDPTGSNNAVYSVLKSYGHDVLYRPRNPKSLDYLEIMWPGEPLHRCKTDSIVLIKDKTIQDWQYYEKILIAREENMYQEDLLLETVTDKLLTLAKYGELSAADLEEYDDEEDDDEYYSSIILN